MRIQTSEWEERISHWIRTLKKDLYLPLEEIRWEMCSTMEQLPLAEARGLAYTPVEPGFSWGHTWEYGWFRAKITLPEAAEGKRIVLDLQPGYEATVFVNGQEFGTWRADWIDEPHHYLEDNFLPGEAHAGDIYEIYMEVYAGHYYPAFGIPDSHTATGPVLEGDYEDPLTEGARRVLGNSTFGIWNEDAYQLYMDVSTLRSLQEVLDESSLRAAKVAEALEQFTLNVDFEQPLEGRIRDYQKAREGLKPALEATNGSTMPKFYAMGNAHIDLAWLWPMAETYRKTARTFAAQLRLLEEYPDYIYIQSQPAAYEMCRKYYPELFERIKEAIRGGRWIADGAMWVEPDTNMASGEALVRQLLYGKKYYKDVLGTDSEVLWLPDTFGYTGALPQILRSFGVNYLVTQKIFWTYNGGEQFPYHYFTWEGMDGSQVTSFLPTSYTYRTSPEEANNVWKNRSQMRDLEAFLYPFGYGDGGGGPCRDHIEYARRYRNLEGSVRMEMTSPKQFFTEMEELGGPKHTYVGELYFTAHRGTYTSQAKIKYNNRKSELLMQQLELWNALNMVKGAAYPAEQLEQLWKTVLLHQFHDILPGSCIARVYEEAEKTFHQFFAEGKALLEETIGKMTGEIGYSVWNSLGFARQAVVTLPEAFAEGVLVDGTPVPVTASKDGWQALIDLPACGAADLRPAAVTTPAKRAVLIGTPSGYLMENDFLQAKINRKGEIISLCLKQDGREREFAAEPMNRFHLYKDVPRRYDAWDIDSNYVDQEVFGAHEVDSMQIVQSSGSRVCLRVSGRIDTSSYVQDITLDACGKRVEFDTTVQWSEQHRLLKVAFPVDVYAENGINEMQFGYVNRPTHRSRAYDRDRFEVCNHRYSALCDGSHGAALLNDCKYGISMNGNALELTLLRGATAPDRHADQGEHHFVYAITAWEGSFFDSDVVKQGYELNVKPMAVASGVKGFSAFSVDVANVILESVKAAEDGSGDLILRLYESKKADTMAEVQFGLDALGCAVRKVSRCNMMEEPEEVLSTDGRSVSVHFRPFEIMTLRVECEKSR